MAQAENERLTEIICGAALSRAVCTIAELGIADQIQPGSPQAVESLAEATGTHARSLYRILRFLASHEIFEEKGNHQFDHTQLSQCLRSDAEGSFRPAARVLHPIFPFWDGLHHSAITGESGFNKIFGRPFFEYLGTHPDLARIFDAAMSASHVHQTAAMLEAYDFSGVHFLADVGGGTGSLVSAVLQRYPKLRGLLFELGHVAGRARESLKACGLDDRCSVIEGNFFGPSLSSMANRLVSLEECGKRSRSAEPSATLKKQSGINGLLPSLASLGGPLHLFRLLLDLCSRFSKRVTITFPREKSLLDFPG